MLRLLVLLTSVVGAVIGQAVRRKCFSEEYIAALNLPTPQRRPGLPPIRIEYQNWGSHNLVSQIGATLLEEVLGFRTTVVGGTYEFEACAKGLYDLAFENWPQSESARYQEWVLKKGLCLDVGALGYTGYNFLSIPQYLIDGHPDANLDVGTLFKTPEVNRIFRRSGSTPQSLMVDPGREFVPKWCALETSPPNCHDQLNTQAYFDFKCNVTKYSPYCFELLDITASWQKNIMQSMIVNMNLNITIPLLGSNFMPYVSSLLATRQPIFLYYWVPTAFAAIHNLQRVRFKEYTDECYSQLAAHPGELNGSAPGVNCDMPTQTLTKTMNPAFHDNVEYRDAVQMFRQFTFSATEMTKSLRSMDEDLVGQALYDNVFNASCTWLLNNKQLWIGWISISPPPPQRILQEITAAMRMSILALVLVLSAIIAILQAVIFAHRSHAAIRGSDHWLSQVTLSGSYVAFAGVCTMGYEQSWSCIITPFLLSFAFVMIFGSTTAKAWRIHSIFCQRTMNVVKITTGKLVKLVALFASYEIAECVVRAVVGQPTCVITAVPNSQTGLDDGRFCVLAYESIFSVLIYTPKVLCLLYGCYLAFQIRNCPSNFNESKFIMLSMYNSMVIAVLLLLLSNAFATRANVQYAVVAVGLAGGVTLSQLFLFGPKLYSIFSNSGAGESKMAVAGQTSGSIARQTLSADPRVEHICRKIAAEMNNPALPIASKTVLLDKIDKLIDQSGRTVAGYTTPKP
ncbi:unnamed protein product (mitochondrion) [Plasmodiophora brassicae]|uniref:G-protein coupled receptors family 3 profile domain-containing protein n=1 Tax=Plasmodiophora brassicae TaxID=37360 RepID=A0A3P3YE41_PLABS|nr:unnamed protein product [Plasmodiophora brassicae]